MRPFSPRSYRTDVVHRARVETREDGDPIDTWPGSGTALLCHVSQATPQTRYGNQAEETATKYVLWFSPAAVLAAGVTLRRGDQFTLPATVYDDAVVLRATDAGADFNRLGVSLQVPCEQVT